MTRAVLALPEPYRETLLLRYFEELDATRIAERLGCTASTVRSRHRRALALLRDTLDAEHGGDRAAWCRALLPLALAAPAGAGAAAGAATSAGTSSGGSASLTGPPWSVPWKEVLLMSGAKKAVIGSLALVLAGTAWWALPRESPTVEDASPVVRAPVVPIPAPADPATPAVAAPVEPLAAPAPAVASAPPPATPADDLPGTPVRFTGRVVDTTGRPIAGADVTFVPDVHTLVAWGHPLSAASRALPDLDLPATRTDGDGRYVLHGRFVVAPGSERVDRGLMNPLRFPEVHASGPRLERTSRVLQGYTGGDLALPDLVVGPGAHVFGQVVDEQGAPVAGARVRGIHLSSEAREASDDVGQTGHASRFLVATSDATGRWRIDGAGPGSGWLEVTAAGFLRYHDREGFELDAGAVVDRGRQVLERGDTLAGRVVDPDGRPVEGALVHAGSGDLAHWDRGTDTILWQVSGGGGEPTDADGAFALSALAGGTQTVWVDAPGFEPRRVEGVAPGRRDLVVEVRPQGVLLVDVVDERTGLAVEDAVLSATRGEGLAGDPPALDVEDRGVDAGDGRFRVARPGLLSTQLTASAPGYATRREDAPGVAVGDTGRHVVRLLPEAVLAGVVVDADGAPVPGADVTLHRVPDVPPEPPSAVDLPGMAGFHARRAWEEQLVADDLTTATADDGRFRFDALTAGTYELTARASGHAPSGVVTTPLTSGGLVDDARVELRASGVVAGVLFGVDGAPARGERVSLFGPGDESHFETTFTDRDGRFRFDELRPGTWRSQVKPGVSQELVVEAGETTEVELFLRARPAFSGRVYDPVTGAGIADARVSLGRFADGDGQRAWTSGNSVTTDAEGRYELVQGWRGPHQLVATLPGGGIASVPVDADWNDALEVDVPVGTGRVTGRLVDASGDPPSSAWVRLRSEVPTYRSVACDADGRFVVEHVSPGAYQLDVFCRDALPVAPVEVVVSAGETVDVEVPVAPGASLACTVRLPNGKPVADGTEVHLLVGDDGHWRRWEETVAGEVRFSAVPPGRHELVVGDVGDAEYHDDDTFIRWREPVTLAAGEARALEIVVER